MARSNVEPQHRSGAGAGGPEVGRRPPFAGAPPFTLEPPRLTGASIDEFLAWASQVPSSSSDLIRAQIDAASSDTVDALLTELGRMPIEDAGRFLLVLATVGELRHDDFVEPLDRLIWSEEELFVVDDGPGLDSSERDRPDADATSFFDARIVIKARAAEMLSYIGSPRADEAILRIIQRHPVTAVRVAAIDAHLFNHGDGVATLDHLLGLVGDEDRPYVGLPRWGRDMDVDAFDAAVVEFYERNPGERPPVPEGARHGRGRGEDIAGPPPRRRGRGT